MLGTNAPQILDALQQIGHVTQQVLHILRGGIRRAGKRAERSHIGEIPPGKAADVQPVRLAAHDVAGALQQVAAQPQAGAQVVGAAGRYVSHGTRRVKRRHAGDDLVERAVAADGNHHVRLGGMARGNLRGLAPGAGHIGQACIVVFFKRGNKVCQVALSLFLPRSRVEDNNHLLRHANPPPVLSMIDTIIPNLRGKSKSSLLSPGKAGHTRQKPAQEESLWANPSNPRRNRHATS